MNLHWPPASRRDPTNARLAAPESDWPDTPALEVLLWPTCDSDINWKLGGKWGRPGRIWCPPQWSKTWILLSSTPPPPLPFSIQTHVSQHPPYKWDGFFVVAPMPSTTGLSGPVILSAIPLPHGLCVTAVPPPTPPPPPSLTPAPKWNTYWPGCSAHNPGT